MDVIVIPVNQSDQPKLVGVDDRTHLRELQKLVGGSIEQISTTRLSIKNNVALVDEDARLKGSHRNVRAEQLIGYPVPLFGTVVLIGVEQNEEGIYWVSYNS